MYEIEGTSLGLMLSFRIQRVQVHPLADSKFQTCAPSDLRLHALNRFLSPAEIGAHGTPCLKFVVRWTDFISIVIDIMRIYKVDTCEAIAVCNGRSCMCYCEIGDSCYLVGGCKDTIL